MSTRYIYTVCVCSTHYIYTIYLHTIPTPYIYTIYTPYLQYLHYVQGYGLTETSACAAIMRMDENVTGTVGPPVQGVHIQVSSHLNMVLGLT